jgi:catechol 2,3-dioxygenase-like lactoylglutathione lyase family enzyme
MLSDKKLKAFIPTINPQKAKTFYRDILGLKLLSEDNYVGVWTSPGGSKVAWFKDPDRNVLSLTE